MATKTRPNLAKSLREALGSPVLIVTANRVYGAEGTLTLGAVVAGVARLDRRGTPLYEVPVADISAVTMFLALKAPAMKAGRR